MTGAFLIPGCSGDGGRPSVVVVQAKATWGALRAMRLRWFLRARASSPAEERSGLPGPDSLSDCAGAPPRAWSLHTPGATPPLPTRHGSLGAERVGGLRCAADHPERVVADRACRAHAGTVW